MKILITANWNQKELERVRAEHPQVEFVVAPKTADAVQEAPDADVVFGRIDRETFLAARQLKWIQSQGAGVETMAVIPELVASNDVVVTNTRGAHAQTIAEHTFGMLISLTRQFQPLEAAQRSHTWLRTIEPPQVGLSDLTLGVVGLGNIGRAIAKRGWAFDMRVIAVDAKVYPRPEYVAEFWGLDQLAALLGQADVVAVSAPLTAQTHGMIGAEQLALLKPTAYLLAISRGGIVDQHALARMLREGRLAGAGLDVVEPEPLPADSELWDTPNLILTPHCSGRSKQTTELASAIFRDNLKRYLAGEPLVNLVDMRRGY